MALRCELHGFVERQGPCNYLTLHSMAVQLTAAYDKGGEDALKIEFKRIVDEYDDWSLQNYLLQKEGASLSFKLARCCPVHVVRGTSMWYVRFCCLKTTGSCKMLSNCAQDGPMIKFRTWRQ